MLKSVYDITAELIEWLNHNLVPLEESVFVYYQGIRRLVSLVDRVEAGQMPKYAALSAIRDYNESEGSILTYDEIRDRSQEYIFSDFGQWAAYMDDEAAARSVIGNRYADPGEALEKADPDISWIVLWIPSNNIAVVYRSPFHAYRAELDPDMGLAAGLERGDHPAYTLPPDLEAALGWSDPEEILAPHFRGHEPVHHF